MKTLLFIVVCSLASTISIAQSDSVFKPSGKPIIQVFGNFDFNATENTRKQYRFWFGRAHLGYQYHFSEQFSGKIVIDAGRPTTVGQIEVSDPEGNDLDVSNNSKEGSYYTMTLKFASLEWRPVSYLRIEAGGILQNHYITQEKFWGYRYLAETFQDRYYKVPSGDLGIIGYFIVNEKLGFDLALTNGEGFRSDQDQYGDVKLAGGIDLKPAKNLQTRLFYDVTNSENPDKPAGQQLLSAFAGYKAENKFRLGGEYNYRVNHQNISNHDLFGWSFYGSCTVGRNTEFFARFDLLQANTATGEKNNWNYQNTGKAYISGIHFKAVKEVSLSLNYQGWQPDDHELKFQHHVLLSFEYKL